MFRSTEEELKRELPQNPVFDAVNSALKSAIQGKKVVLIASQGQGGHDYLVYNQATRESVVAPKIELKAALLSNFGAIDAGVLTYRRNRRQWGKHDLPLNEFLGRDQGNLRATSYEASIPQDRSVTLYCKRSAMGEAWVLKRDVQQTRPWHVAMGVVVGSVASLFGGKR